MIQRDVQSHSPRRLETGFTLLEVMVAMSVFLVGVVGILGLFATALAVHRDASQRTVATIASDEVRTVVEANLAELAVEGAELPVLKDQVVPGYPGYFYNADLTVAEEGPGEGIFAEVFVYTIDAGQKRGERFRLFVRPNTNTEQLIRAARAAGSNAIQNR